MAIIGERIERVMALLARAKRSSSAIFCNPSRAMVYRQAMIDILFFGRVADMQGKRRMTMDLPQDGMSLFALRLRLFNGEADDRMRMSVNQVVVMADQALHEGDEVAFFSVFSGG